MGNGLGENKIKLRVRFLGIAKYHSQNNNTNRNSIKRTLKVTIKGAIQELLTCGGHSSTLFHLYLNKGD